MRGDGMARPAKSIYATSKNLTKDEFENRKAVEDNLRGDVSLIAVPPDNLSNTAKETYTYLYDLLKNTKIIGVLDRDLMIKTSNVISLDRELHIEMNRAKSKGDMELWLSIIRAIKSNNKDFFRCCNELCLSPQSRAKLSIATSNLEQEEIDPIDLAMSMLPDD